jgi:hypothetical protein
MRATSSKAAANDHAAAEPAADHPPKSWPFAYALGLALAISALLWAVIAAIIHYS